MSIISRNKSAKFLLFSKKAITRTQTVAIIIVLIIAIAAAYFATDPTIFRLDGGSNGNGNGGQQTQQPDLPDLEVSHIGAEPFPPKVDQKFFIQVRVTNIGDAKSGSYTLHVWIEDPSNPNLPTHSLAYGVEQDPLGPGENRLWDRWVEGISLSEGWHQFFAAVEPIGFQDDDTNNVFNTESFWVSTS